MIKLKGLGVKLLFVLGFDRGCLKGGGPQCGLDFEFRGGEDRMAWDFLVWVGVPGGVREGTLIQSVGQSEEQGKSKVGEMLIHCCSGWG